MIETLGLLGVEAAFGVPGVHALANWDALRRGSIRYVGARTELAAAFAADGYARASGRPAALLLSTGPGALISLAGLMEAAASYVPVIALSSQIESALIGRRSDALHELADQTASFAPVVKWADRAMSVEAIPQLVAEAWIQALELPTGPVLLEIPVDLLSAPTDMRPPDRLPANPCTRSHEIRGSIDHAVSLLNEARQPVLLAGGGVMRSAAWDPFRELAEFLDAPVLTTFMGKGALSEEHPLACGSACDELTYKETLRGADVVLCVGSSLGEEATSGYRLHLDGTLVQVDASPARIGARYPAVPIIGDAATVLRELLRRIDNHTPRDGARRAAQIRGELDLELDQQDASLERGLLTAIRAALPAQGIHCWDMTILSYWAAREFPALAPRRFLYPVGSGTLGYAWPAAIGAAVAEPDVPTLAVMGDGGVMYALGELASARQAAVNATLLIIDDGGYGILREYQTAAFGAVNGVELCTPNFCAVAEAFGVYAHPTTPDRLELDLTHVLSRDEPTVLVLSAHLRAPTTMHPEKIAAHAIGEGAPITDGKRRK